jgi:hypothetical protein
VQAIQTAAPGDVVELAPGEYRGPLVIDKPITLRGQDRKTMIWRRTGPAIWVRAPNVRLQHIAVERTVFKHGPLIVHDKGCAPKGVESIEMDALVSLGEMLPGVTLTVPIAIETGGRATLDASGVAGARVSPAVLESAGSHTVQVTIDGKAINRSEVILGELAIREGDSVRYIWLSGLAVESLNTLDQPLALTAKNIRLYPSPNGCAIGPLLRALKIDAPGDAVHILHDSTGYFLYLSAEAPVSLNNAPVNRWTRLPLHEKDTLTVGETVLIIQIAEPAPILLDSLTMTYREFTDQFPDALVMNIRNGRAVWKGRVISTVPWAEPDPTTDVRIPAARTSAWTIGLTAHALTLPDGLYSGNLIVAGSNHAQAVDLALAVKRPEVALQVASLNLGVAEWGWPLERTETLIIENFGRGPWTGSVRSNVPWLQVTPEMPLTCGPWAQIEVPIRVLPTWETMPPGLINIPDALTISGRAESIGARLNIMPGRGHVVPLTETLHFEGVERNAPSPDLTLALRNDGPATWTGRATPANGWVRVRPEALTIPAGETIEVEVTLIDVPTEAVIDTALLVDELRFEGDGAEIAPVAVTLTVVELPPFLVVNTVSFPPFVRGDQTPEALLHIQNMGPTRWRGEITTTLPWLVAPERAFACEPDNSIEVLITLNSAALESVRSGFSHWDRVLHMTGGREPVAASVEIDIRDAVSELHLDTPLLNFGRLDGITPGSDTLRLINGGPSAWRGQLKIAADWIGGARQFEVEVPGMNSAEITFTTTEAVRRLPVGALRDPQAIILKGGDQELRVSGLALIEETAPALTLTPAALDLQDTPQPLTIRNTGQKSWSLALRSVSWLSVSPDQITLAGGAEAVVKVTRQGSTPRTDPRAIVIVGAGREYAIAATVKDKE